MTSIGPIYHDNYEEQIDLSTVNSKVNKTHQKNGFQSLPIDIQNVIKHQEIDRYNKKINKIKAELRSLKEIKSMFVNERSNLIKKHTSLMKKTQ